MYNDQSALLLDLKKQCGYEKTIDFFRKSKGLHSYFEKKGGEFDKAIRHAKHSMEEKLADGRNWRRGNSPWIAPAPLTKYLSTTEHEERQVTDSMHLCSQPLYL